MCSVHKKRGINMRSEKIEKALETKGEERWKLLGQVTEETLKERISQRASPWRGSPFEAAVPLNKELEGRLIEAFKNTNNYRLRSVFAFLMGEVGGESSIPVLIEALNSTEKRDFKLVAIEALGKIGGPQALKVLRKHASHDPDELIRGTAVQALQVISSSEHSPVRFGQEAIGDLRNFLKHIENADPSPYVRAMVEG
ncbi:MAG: hypothetical protein DRH12_06575 [Deltaproteobacteria bacterium]|nr:MAG: hypothetical protein DRH12_06575 [Deltaproteobacteria bacterium]